MAESIDTGEWGAPIRIRAERSTDDITPIWLSLSPQSKLLECDADGNILLEYFPLMFQARLFKWNSVLSGAVYSLEKESDEIFIDENGLITVTEDAELDYANSISVHAEYQGAVYTNVLTINIDKRSSAPKYLGTVDNLPDDAMVFILKGPARGQVRARQSDYVLAVAPIGERNAGSVFQWTGAAWEFRSPENYSDLYIRCFADGLDVPGLAYDMEWFIALFAQKFFAQQAIIKELQAQLINVQGAIFGGERFINENGRVIDKGKNLSGFCIEQDGKLKASGAEISGHIEATSGTLDNLTIKESATFLGTIKSGPVFISNETTASVPPTTFNAGTNVNTIVNTIGINKIINVASGTSGSKSGLISIITTHSYIRTQTVVAGTIMFTGYQHTWNFKLLFNDSTELSFTGTGHNATSTNPTSPMNNYSGTIAQRLQFGGSIPGKIFRIENLPIGSAGLHVGSVYRNGNQLMIV
jgi:hypothetical protein